MIQRSNVLIAGIGGASLGTEILKCLSITDRYTIFGCDISNAAYGHYQPEFEATFVIDRNHYIESVIDICKKLNTAFIIPGGEAPMVLLNEARQQLADHKITLVGNSAAVIQRFSNKQDTFTTLSELGFPVPYTQAIHHLEEIDNAPFPCIIKPATHTGGSSFVSLAVDKDEAILYSQQLLNIGQSVLLQEYIPEAEGEFTVGILSLSDQTIVGSIALKRLFHTKLSVLTKSEHGLISSGYTQGLIDHFSDICAACEKIAIAIESTGPINIQGRVKHGVFLPFEINPRFSASTYLRAMAGFNEVDLYLQHLMNQTYVVNPITIQPGYYLRSLAEVFVTKEALK